MNRLVRYSVDIVNNRYVSGWCFHRLRKHKPLHLVWYADDLRLGEVVAGRYRKDLQLKKVHPTGLCGFDFNFPSDIDICDYQVLSVHINGTSRPLATFATADILRIPRVRLPKIFFMHIPKTAGTSFNAFMRLLVPHEKWKIHIEAEEPDRYPSFERNKDYLAGHLTLEKIRKSFSLSRFNFYTIVREPYAHLHSHLKWVYSVAHDPESIFFARHNKTIARLADKLQHIDFTNKRHVQRLVEGLEGFELDFFDNCQTRYFLDVRPHNRVSVSDFNEARNNMDLFRCIGTTEHYDEFIENFCRLHNLAPFGKSEPFNRSMQGGLIDIEDKEMQEILFPLVETDLLLYDAIRQYCPQNISEM